eukprot:5614506-Prymnesium_polylepis.2
MCVTRGAAQHEREAEGSVGLWGVAVPTAGFGELEGGDSIAYRVGERRECHSLCAQWSDSAPTCTCLNFTSLHKTRNTRSNRSPGAQERTHTRRRPSPKEHAMAQNIETGLSNNVN